MGRPGGGGGLWSFQKTKVFYVFLDPIIVTFLVYAGHFRFIHFTFEIDKKYSDVLSLSLNFYSGLTGSNAAVAVAEVCGCLWLRFLAVLRDLYD